MEWRTCKEFPDYWISEFGDVVSGGLNRVLKGFIDYDGYPSYKITDKDGKKRQVAAHRLVAFAFLPPPSENQTQVRHKNGSRLCAHYSNVEWGTAMKNREDTRRHGTSPTKGERNPKAKITEKDVLEIRRIHRDIKEGRSAFRVIDLAKKYDLHVSSICNIASGKSWGHVK